MSPTPATDWQSAYWELIYKKGSYIDSLRQLNEKQASKIMELEFYLSCIKFVGDTAYVDANKMTRMKRVLEAASRSGLRRSRYYRSENDK